MAKKDKQKTKNIKKRILIIGAVCAIALPATLITIEVARTIVHNSNASKNLEAAKQGQQQVEQRIKAADPNLNTKVSDDCYDSQAGFRTEETVCSQTLEANGKYTSIEELEIAAAKISSMLQSQPSSITINFKSLTFPTTINTNTDYSYSDEVSSQSSDPYCSASYDVYSPREINPQDRNTLRFYTYCSERLRGRAGSGPIFLIEGLINYVSIPVFLVLLLTAVAYGTASLRLRKKK